MCNMLQLNREKTEFFVAASSHIKNQMPAVKLQVGNETIEPSEKVRNLGVIFDTSMTMCNQISSLSRNVTFHLRNISRIRRFLDFDSCNDIIRSLILSRLDYGNVLLMGANSTDISRLQTLQNWAAKLIFRARKQDHASPLLRQLHWLPIRDRITFKVMLYVFKCLAGIGPEYLSSCLELYNPTSWGPSICLWWHTIDCANHPRLDFQICCWQDIYLHRSQCLEQIAILCAQCSISVCFQKGTKISSVSTNLMFGHAFLSLFFNCVLYIFLHIFVSPRCDLLKWRVK